MSIADALAKALTKEGVKSDKVKDIGLYLSTGIPNVDYALSGKYRGGGFKSARIHEIAGPPSAGKTQLATAVMIGAQQAGGASDFQDHERSFDEKIAREFGLDTTPGIYTYKRPRSFEESLNQAIDWMETIRGAKVIPFEAPLVVVFDSFAAMVPEAKLERKNGLNMKDKLSLATAASQELPGFNALVEENNALVLFLNQLRTKPGVMFGDPRYTVGGEALPYYASTRMYLGRSVNKDKKTKEFLGQSITAETIKNKTYRPFVKTSWEFKFREDGSGYIDPVESMIDHLIEIEGIERDGTKIVWEGQSYDRTKILAAVEKTPNALDVLITMAEKKQGVV